MRGKKISASGTLNIIHDPSIILEQYRDLLKSANSDVNLVCPTINAYFRHRRTGIFELLGSHTKNSSVKVRILLPVPRDNKDSYNELKTQFNNSRIEYRTLDKRTEGITTFVVVDKMVALLIELKDDAKPNFEEAVDFAILSNSKQLVTSYSSLFETLWQQTELSEHILHQNSELQRKNDELHQLHQDLSESFEFLSKTTQKLQRANEELDAQLKVQSEFINVAAHELRTPTQAIIGYCEMLEVFPEKIKTYVETLKRNAERLNILTSDLLDVTKMEAGILKLNTSKFNLTDTINETIADIIKKAYAMTGESGVNKNIPTINFYSVHPVFVTADKDRITQVLSNLLDNAIKFTPSGEIKITMNEDYSTNKITIRIRDTGTGIDNEIYSKLFQKFTTRSMKGTGLGLYISKNIVEAHGGDIIAENNEGGPGATFSFSLPLTFSHN